MNVSIINPPRPDLSEWLTSAETSESSSFEGVVSFISEAFEFIASNPFFKILCGVLLLAIALFVIRMMIKTAGG